MASGVQGPKQTKGYFVVLSSLSTNVQYNIASGSGAGGSYLPGTVSYPTSGTGVAAIPAGSYLKDMGKTVLSSTHTYRKVQLVTANAYPGAGAVAAATGLPFYIELPGSNLPVNPATQVAYLPGLM